MVPPAAAVINQSAFRARKDAGALDTGAEWLADKDAGWTQVVDSEFRIRLLMQETGGSAKNNYVGIVEYDIDTGGGYSGSWTTITTSTPIQVADGTRADGSDCGESYLEGSGTQDQSNAGYDDVDGSAGGGANDIPANGHSEMEYVLLLDSGQVSAGDKIKVRDANADAWGSVPEITASVAAQEEMAGSSDVVISSSGTLKGKGSLGADSEIVVSASGGLKGSGRMGGTSSVVVTTLGGLTSGAPSGDMAGVSEVVVSASGGLKGSGRMGATSSVVVSSSGEMLQPGTMGASSSVVISSAARLYVTLEGVRIVLIEKTVTVADGDKLRIRGVRTSGSDSAITVPEASYLLVER